MQTGGSDRMREGPDRAPKLAPALRDAAARFSDLTGHGCALVFADVPEDSRIYFAETAALCGRLRCTMGLPLPQLSMGMSADFEVAVEEGSTIVRVGTALFGARP